MAAESVSTSDLSRIWLIEFLSDCKGASASLLNELIQKTPALLDPLAKNARERVSLRCLEDIVCFNTARDVAPTLGSKADIALSESCQDVLQRVVSKVPMSNSRDARSKLSEWNLDLFIMHKRASLPKCVLLQLKDAEARLSFPLNLKEGEATNSNANRGVTDMNVTNSEIVLNEVPGKNLLPSKREELVGEKAAEHINENLGVDKCVVPDSESESDDYHDEEADIASKKRRFFSQCTLSSRSLETNYLTEATLCMKCNRSGRLLVCSSSSCPLVIHEDCLGSSASFSELGNFYCPFCSYSHAILEYREAKRKNSLARKELSAFTGVGIKRRRKRLSRLYSSEQDQLRNRNVEECCHSNNSGHRNFVNPHCRSTEDELVADGHTAVCNLINGETYSRSFDPQNGATENTVQADGHHQREISENGQKSNECEHESNIIYDGGYRKELGPLHGVQQADEQVKENGLATSDHVKTVTSHPRSNKDTHATSCVDRKGEGSAISRAGCVGTEVNGRVGNTIQELASEKVVGERLNQSQENTKCSFNTQEHAEAGSQRKVTGVVTTQRSRQASAIIPFAYEDITEGESDTRTSHYSTRSRCQGMRYTYPAIPCLRRRKLAWTEAEVEILKEGVHRFSENSDKGIPWKEILEFGKFVFEKGRTTVDLKDKWRNICKASWKSR